MVRSSKFWMKIRSQKVAWYPCIYQLLLIEPGVVHLDLHNWGSWDSWLLGDWLNERAESSFHLVTSCCKSVNLLLDSSLFGFFFLISLNIWLFFYVVSSVFWRWVNTLWKLWCKYIAEAVMIQLWVGFTYSTFFTLVSDKHLCLSFEKSETSLCTLPSRKRFLFICVLLWGMILFVWLCQGFW